MTNFLVEAMRHLGVYFTPPHILALGYGDGKTRAYATISGNPPFGGQRTMYQNYLQLLEATLAKYENAETLCCDISEDGPRAHYAHVNGIGCAVGCHLSAQQAQQLETLLAPNGEYAWREIHARDDVRALVGDIFDNIDLEDMDDLQYMHDSAIDAYDYGSERVADFRDELRSKIAILKRNL